MNSNKFAFGRTATASTVVAVLLVAVAIARLPVAGAWLAPHGIAEGVAMVASPAPSGSPDRLVEATDPAANEPKRATDTESLSSDTPLDLPTEEAIDRSAGVPGQIAVQDIGDVALADLPNDTTVPSPDLKRGE